MAWPSGQPHAVMESVPNKACYSHCDNPLLPAHPVALDEAQKVLLDQRALDIYNFRPRNTPVMSKREVSRSVPTAVKRDRGKPANRSRTTYNKRLQVNARERERMKILNKGFENLRNALPCYIADGHISKITTLRLAINYIKTLTDVLKDTGKAEFGSEGQPRDALALMQNLKPETLIYQSGGRIEMAYRPPFCVSTTSLPSVFTKTHPEIDSSSSNANVCDTPKLFEEHSFLESSKAEN